MSCAIYNEIEPYPVAWLGNLIDAGHIADGLIDSRSIADVHPDDVRHVTQFHTFAGIGVWSYALRLAGWPDDVPVWTGSCPCFPQGTLVLTDSGYLPIERISVGDMVLTHKARFKRVTHVGSERSKCVTVKGQGHPGLVCTPDHPFLARDGDGAEEWQPASKLKGLRWASVAHVPSRTIPDFPRPNGVVWDSSISRWRAKGERNGKPVYLGVFKDKRQAISARAAAVASGAVSVRGADAADVLSLGFARFLGYWAGDGWTTGGNVVICGAQEHQDLIGSIFTAAGLSGEPYAERTSSRIRCGSRALSRWLRSHFGDRAHNKRIPAWLHGAPEDYRKAFLQGYMLADGHIETPSNGGAVERYTTVSKALAIGVRVLLNQAGFSASITLHAPPKTTTIEGRLVKARPFYRVTAYESARSFRFSERHGWGLVRKVEPATTRRVYNIAVEDDESYTADGIVVHNCQPFSAAGKGRGVEDERHLWPVWRDLIAECLPPVVFGEQVASPAGRAWLATVSADLEALGYRVDAADLCAAGIGAPHIRQRLFFGAIRLADAKGERREARRLPIGACASQSVDPVTGGLGDADRSGLAGRPSKSGDDGALLASAQRAGSQPWAGVEWLACRDGKARPTQPGLHPLAHGATARVGKLRAAGNAIVPQVAATFVTGFMQSVGVWQ